ncbi:MAG: hypothetical protein R2753_03410 [Chitinophagales bacterium]
MFRNIFSKRFKSRTGFFKVENDNLIEINELAGTGSINDFVKSLGFPANHIHIVHTFDSDKISCLGFLTLSKKLQIVLAKSPETKISFSDVLKAKNNIDWSFEYSDLNIEDIFQEGIDLENFDLEFLKSVIDLSFEDKDLYKSNEFGLYLQFEDEVLKAFTSSEWDNASTKWLKERNENMVNEMIEEAKQFHNNQMEIMEEVNIQTGALLDTPEALKNEFIPLHTKSNGNINFYNLLISHYNQSCKKDEFLFINKGRYKQINEQLFEVGGFNFEFGNDNKLLNVFES